LRALRFFFLYIIIDLFSHLDVILKQGIPFGILLNYYVSYVPIIFTQVAPISCLLSGLYTFARMNKENEIIAMRSSGLSILWISRVVIVFGLIVTGTVFLVNDKLVPRAMLASKKMQEQMEGETAKSSPDKKSRM